MNEKYDKNDRDSIISYAKKATGKKISELIEVDIELNAKDKGAVGNLIQEHYFGISRNSSKDPDFKEAGIELKSFAYWDEDGKKPRADQRLALSKIDFMEFETMIPFGDSHLYSKCKTMLMMAYLLKLDQQRIDSKVKYVRVYEFDKLVKRDLEQIEKDYLKIIKKINKGEASKLSEADTEFLGAARTGDKDSNLEEAPKNDKALPRRFALKQSYMSYLVREYIVPEKDFDKKSSRPKTEYRIKIPRGKNFEEWLDAIDEKYVGKTAKKINSYSKIKKIAGIVDLSKKRGISQIGLAMLGIKSNYDDYLKKTNTVVKSVRITANGIIRDDWSFPNFIVEDIKNQEWEESEVFMYLSEQRILMQIFVQEEDEYVYKGHLFLKFTPEQLDKDVKATWEAFKEKVINGIKFELKIDKGGVKVCSDVQGKTKGQIGLIKLHATDTTYDISRENIVANSEEAMAILEANTVDGRFIWKAENRNKYGCSIKNQDVITKQSFWLNDDFVLEYIRENKPEIFANKEE